MSMLWRYHENRIPKNNPTQFYGKSKNELEAEAANQEAEASQAEAAEDVDTTE